MNSLLLAVIKLKITSASIVAEVILSFLNCVMDSTKPSFMVMGLVFVIPTGVW